MIERLAGAWQRARDLWRSSGSPPDRISTGTRAALSSSMTLNTSSVFSSPWKSLSAEIE